MIAQNLVLVRSNDGRVTAFDAAAGERRWFHAEEGPTLSVRGNAPIVIGPGVVFVGNDSGTLSALALQDGRPLWEQAIGVPEGRTELERMADVDGAFGARWHHAVCHQLQERNPGAGRPERPSAVDARSWRQPVVLVCRRPWWWSPTTPARYGAWTRP